MDSELWEKICRDGTITDRILYNIAASLEKIADKISEIRIVEYKEKM